MPNSKNLLDKKYRLIAETIRSYPLQIRQAWDEINAIYIPDDYQNIKNLILCGMGGSALGARILDSLLVNRLRIPFQIFNEYSLPNYVDDETLVIASSYSGNTEETIEATYEAMSRGAKLFGITTGGKLKDILKERNTPSYVFNPVNNQSGQPRMAIGYSVGSIMAVLARLKVIILSNEEIDEAITSMNNALTEFHEGAPEETNIAKKFSKKLKGRVPIIIASEHLVGTIYTIKNQFNETAKTFSVIFDIPELNHHLMEGLKHPPKIRELFHFIFVQSNLYSEAVKKRYPLTYEVVEKNGFAFDVFSPVSTTKLSQVFETLAFGSFVVYFLTRNYNIDPIDIPWVDYFKKRLSGR